MPTPNEPGKGMATWADSAMFRSAAMPEEAKNERTGILPQVHLVNATVDPLGSLAAACMMYEGRPCYSLQDVTDDDRRRYWEQSRKTHLKAPWEFIHLHLMLEGVTRSFTHQLVRQRTAVYAQESLRFAVKENLEDEAAMPPSLWSLPDDAPRKVLWKNALREAQAHYEQLIDNGMPAEDARGLLPHAVTTRVHWGTNLRGLLEHAGNRLCTQAQFEWKLVMAGVMKAMRNRNMRTDDSDPLGQVTRHSLGLPDPENEMDGWQWQEIVKTFRPVCYQLGRCPFTSDFDRGCTIRDRVQAGQFGDIQPEEWLYDPMAAR